MPEAASIWRLVAFLCLTLTEDAFLETRSCILCVFDVTSVRSEVCVRVLLTEADTADTVAVVKQQPFFCLADKMCHCAINRLYNHLTRSHTNTNIYTRSPILSNHITSHHITQWEYHDMLLFLWEDVSATAFGTWSKTLNVWIKLEFIVCISINYLF